MTLCHLGGEDLFRAACLHTQNIMLHNPFISLFNARQSGLQLNLLHKVGLVYLDKPRKGPANWF